MTIDNSLDGDCLLNLPHVVSCETFHCHMSKRIGYVSDGVLCVFVLYFNPFYLFHPDQMIPMACVREKS